MRPHHERGEGSIHHAVHHHLVSLALRGEPDSRRQLTEPARRLRRGISAVEGHAHEHIVNADGSRAAWRQGPVGPQPGSPTQGAPQQHHADPSECLQTLAQPSSLVAPPPRPPTQRAPQAEHTAIRADAASPPRVVLPQEDTLLFWLSMASLAAPTTFDVPSDPALSGAEERVQTLLEALAKYDAPRDPCVVVRHEDSSGYLDTLVWLRERGTEGTTSTLSANQQDDGDIWVDGVLHTWHPSGEPASERVVGLEDGIARETIAWERDDEGRVLEQRRVVDKGYGVQHWDEVNRYTANGEIRRRETRVEADLLVTEERTRLRWRDGRPVSRRSRWTQTTSPSNRCRSDFQALPDGWVETRRCSHDDVPLVRTVQHNRDGHLVLEETTQTYDDWTSLESRRWTWDGDRYLTLDRFRPMIGDVHSDYTWDGDRLVKVVEQGISHRVVWLWGEGCPARPLPEPAFEP